MNRNHVHIPIWGCVAQLVVGDVQKINTYCVEAKQATTNHSNGNSSVNVIHDNSLQNFMGHEMLFAAEKLSSMVLIKMGTTDNYLNTNIKNVMVIVPAYPFDLWHHTSNNASVFGQFHVMRISNASMIAVIAYSLTKQANIFGEKNIVFIFDPGSGQFDVCSYLLKCDILHTITTYSSTKIVIAEHLDYIVDPYRRFVDEAQATSNVSFEAYRPTVMYFTNSFSCFLEELQE